VLHVWDVLGSSFQALVSCSLLLHSPLSHVERVLGLSTTDVRVPILFFERSMAGLTGRVGCRLSLVDFPVVLIQRLIQARGWLCRVSTLGSAHRVVLRVVVVRRRRIRGASVSRVVVHPSFKTLLGCLSVHVVVDVGLESVRSIDIHVSSFARAVLMTRVAGLLAGLGAASPARAVITVEYLRIVRVPGGRFLEALVDSRVAR